jgi:hypothetical protein
VVTYPLNFINLRTERMNLTRCYKEELRKKKERLNREREQILQMVRCYKSKGKKFRPTQNLVLMNLKNDFIINLQN